MREVLAMLLIVIMVSFIGHVLTLKIEARMNKKEDIECIFYDGEGNKIPTNAVRLLVRSQFVLMNNSEEDTIRKYFYMYDK